MAFGGGVVRLQPLLDTCSVGPYQRYIKTPLDVEKIYLELTDEAMKPSTFWVDCLKTWFRITASLWNNSTPFAFQKRLTDRIHVSANEQSLQTQWSSLFMGFFNPGSKEFLKFSHTLNFSVTQYSLRTGSLTKRNSIRILFLNPIHNWHAFPIHYCCSILRQTFFQNQSKVFMCKTPTKQSL